MSLTGYKDLKYILSSAHLLFHNLGIFWPFPSSYRNSVFTFSKRSIDSTSSGGEPLFYWGAHSFWILAFILAIITVYHSSEQLDGVSVLYEPSSELFQPWDSSPSRASLSKDFPWIMVISNLYFASILNIWNKYSNFLI